MQLGKLLENLQGTVSVHYDPNNGYTQCRSLLAHGVKVCGQCGTPQPIERTHCKSCKQEIFVQCHRLPFSADALYELYVMKEAMRYGKVFTLMEVQDVFKRLYRSKTLHATIWAKVKRNHLLKTFSRNGKHYVCMSDLQQHHSEDPATQP
jgi:predicted amidophosphoribosyltransferase